MASQKHDSSAQRLRMPGTSLRDCCHLGLRIGRKTRDRHGADFTERRYTIAAMRGWSELAERVAGTTRTSEKTAILAGYLAELPGEELRPAATFLTGRPFSEADQRAVGLGWATIAAAVSSLASAPAGALGEAYDRSSDLGTAVADVLSLRIAQPDPQAAPTMRELAEAFEAIEAAPGPAAT